METKHSKGTWSVGRPGTVITDCPDGFTKYTGHGGKAAVNYYGGYLIAESIIKPADAKLMAAAPEMYEHLIAIVNGTAFDKETGLIWMHRVVAIEELIKKINQ
jgi:hypothetical protein